MTYKLKKWTWIETTREVYSAIYNRHVDNFLVFGTITDMSADPRHLMTEWGFRGAETPLIKQDQHGGNSRFYIVGNITAEGD